MANAPAVWNGRWPNKRGTLCCLVRRTDSVPGLYLLSAAHVLAPPGEIDNPVPGDPVFCDFGGDIAEKLATLSNWNVLVPGGDPVNMRDAAIARVLPQFEQRLLGAVELPVGYTGVVGVAQALTIRGAVTGTRQTTVTETRASGAVFEREFTNGVVRRIGYSPQTVFSTHYATQGGDSGCAVLDERGQLAGMLIGGLHDSDRSYFGYIQSALDYLHIRPLTEAAAGQVEEGQPVAAGLAERAAGATPSPGALLPPVRNKATAADVLARTLWGEARGEGRDGMTAVACVVVNRARRGPNYWWGGFIEDVCRKPFQFSCWNQNDPNREKLLHVTDSDAAFRTCFDVADSAANGRIEDVTRGATHYHDRSVLPGWARNKVPCARIGGLFFYNDIEPLSTNSMALAGGAG